jgi:hypothetical protein
MKQKEAEKDWKTYKSIDAHRMCNMTCMIIPVLIGESGIVTKDLKENL